MGLTLSGPSYIITLGRAAKARTKHSRRAGLQERKGTPHHSGVSRPKKASMELLLNQEGTFRTNSGYGNFRAHKKSPSGSKKTKNPRGEGNINNTIGGKDEKVTQTYWELYVNLP